MFTDSTTNEFMSMYIQAMYRRYMDLASVDFRGLTNLPHEKCVIPDNEFNALCDKLDEIQLGKSEVIINTALNKATSKFYSKLVTFLGVDGEPIRAMNYEYHIYPVIMLDCYVYDFMLRINAAPIGEYIDFLLAFNNGVRMSTEFTWMPFADNMPGLINWSMYEQLTSPHGLSFNYTLSQRKESA